MRVWEKNPHQILNQQFSYNKKLNEDPFSPQINQLESTGNGYQILRGYLEILSG